MKRTLALLAVFATVQCFAQIENDTHVFWQPGAKLTFEMFQGEPSDSAYVKKLTDLNIYHQIATGLWSALDVPDKKGWKKGVMEKYYFCAAMEKGNSFFIVKDSTELKYAQLVWDICEVSARIARRNLTEFVNSLNEGLKEPANGGAAIQFMTCLNDGKQFGHEMTMALFDYVITTRDEEAYIKFRELVDKYLTELEDYATTPEDIHRLTSHQPEKGFVQAQNLTGDFKERGEIRY